MFKLLGLLLASWVFSSCDKEHEEINTSISSSSHRYLALGDSYTIGESVSSVERFPYLTTQSLIQSGIKIVEPEYIATTGWTTSNLLNAIKDRRPKVPYDFVTLLIGVNDQYQRLDTAGYRLRFTQLLNIATELAGNRKERVFVLSIPDYSATPFVTASEKERVRREIGDFNLINKQVTLDNGIVYIDITPSTQLAATDLSLLASDRLHYSVKAHQIWADMLIPFLKRVL